MVQRDIEKFEKYETYEQRYDRHEKKLRGNTTDRTVGKESDPKNTLK